MNSTIELPGKPPEIDNEVHRLLGVWADGDLADICETVDAQIELLGSGRTDTYPINETTKRYMSLWMTVKADKLFTKGSVFTLAAKGQRGMLSSHDGRPAMIQEKGHRTEAGWYGYIQVVLGTVVSDGTEWDGPQYVVRACDLRGRNQADVVPTDVVEAPSISHGEALARIVELEAKLEQAEAQSLRNSQAYMACQRDFTRINEGLNEAADRRDFCSEYEDLMEGIAASCERFEFEGREQEYEVSVRVPVTVYCDVSTTVLMSRNADSTDIAEAALENVENNYSESSLLDYADTYSAEADYSAASIEVQ